MSVDKRMMQLDDSVTITVTLEDAFASISSIRIPLENLVIDGQPSVSSEFDFINGVTSRRKVFRYVAHATGPGAATVGPVTLHGTGGQVETLAPIAIQVLPDAAAGTNDPSKILRELITNHADPIFLVATVDKPNVFENEEVIVTWWLFNAASVQEYGIAEIPKLEDFWSEELDVRGEQPQQVLLDGIVVQKLAIRRVALFPLRSGSLTVPSMGMNASIMKRIRTSNPFGMYEGMEVDVHRRSAPVSIHARPLPPGPPVAAVGDVTMRCGIPVQRNGGPVTMSVVLTGRANLRGAAPPAFERKPDGTLQIINGATSVDRRHDDATMTHRWQYLIFPLQTGPFTVPAMRTRILTSAGAPQDLQCAAITLAVRAASPGEPPPLLAHRKSWSMRPFVIAAAVILLGAIALKRLQR
ncbi:MAG TPA: BatD family protein, partial [Thermoanaerobaculia bacterium]|nr:BatD family protein [Thermoanaerobaculia bacterium]